MRPATSITSVTCVRIALFIASLGALCPALERPLSAQTTSTLTITAGGTSTFPNPTAADYDNGFIDNSTPIAFSVAMTGTGANTARTHTVEVCAVSSTLGTGKALTDLQWRPGDLSKPFASIVQGCSSPVSSSRIVQQTSISKNGSFTNSVLLRMLLHWTADVQSSYGTTIQMTLTVTTP
jgi:hypothetical protein